MPSQHTRAPSGATLDRCAYSLPSAAKKLATPRRLRLHAGHFAINANKESATMAGTRISPQETFDARYRRYIRVLPWREKPDDDSGIFHSRSRRQQDASRVGIIDSLLLLAGRRRDARAAYGYHTA